MAVRIAFDLDGVLADFETAYRGIEQRLFGPGKIEGAVETPETRAEDEDAAATGAAGAGRTHGLVRPKGHRERVWKEIEATPDFWASLEPIDPAVIPRIQTIAAKFRWEVLFITQRPHTAGETVQRQTQRWLIRHGFDMPSVFVLKGSRGKVADALHLDFVIDDSTQNCVDIVSESRTRAILVLRDEDAEGPRPQRARQLGIGVVPSISACLDFLEEYEATRTNPTLLQKVARLVGLRSAPTA